MSLLAGLIFDDRGRRLTPGHAAKGSRRYRYYVTPSNASAVSMADKRAWRIPANEVEQIVRSNFLNLMRTPEKLDNLLDLNCRSPAAKLKAYQAAAARAPVLEHARPAEWRAFLVSTLERMTLRPNTIELEVRPAGFTAAIEHDVKEAAVPSIHSDDSEDVPTTCLQVRARLKRCGDEMGLVLFYDGQKESLNKPDPGLTAAMAKAHVWARQLITGEMASIAEIARGEGTSRPHASRLLNLAFLAPDIVEAILDGRQPPEDDLEALTKTDRLPFSWQDRRRVLGFS